MRLAFRFAAAFVASASLLITLAPVASAGTADQSRVTLSNSPSPWAHAGNGVLIPDPASATSSAWILTTRSLASAMSSGGKTIWVKAGVCSVDDPGTVAKVQYIYSSIVPPIEFENDIALLQLEMPLVYDANIQPATLPPAYSSTVAGVSALITGWWRSSCTGPLDHSCQSITMEVITDAELEAYWSTHVNAEMFGVFDHNHVTTIWNGGLGAGVYGPNGVLSGLASWGASGCGKANYPQVCTRVSFYVDWINDITAAMGTKLSTSSHTPCCPGLKLSAFGGPPHIPNPGLGLKVENMPVPGGAMLVVSIGSLTGGVSVAGGGGWYLDPLALALSPFYNFSPTGTAPCDGTATFPLPIPSSIPSSAVGVVVSAQAVVLCPGFAKGYTNGWQFVLN